MCFLDRLKSFPISVPRYHTPQTDQKSCRQSIGQVSCSLFECVNLLLELLSPHSFFFPFHFFFFFSFFLRKRFACRESNCVSLGKTDSGEEKKEVHAFAEIQRDFPRTRSKAPTKSDLLVPRFSFYFHSHARMVLSLLFMVL